MNTSDLFPTLVLAALALGVVHTLAPDHWLPIAAVSRARHWSRGRTARWALLLGGLHLAATALVTLLALVASRELGLAVAGRLATFAAYLLIGGGLTYAAVALALRAQHRTARPNAEQRLERFGLGTLAAYFIANPCVPLIPLLFATAPLGASAVGAVGAVYASATLLTLTGAALAARAGFAVVRPAWLAGRAELATGLLFAAAGLAALLWG
jgi:hypothetical protein